MAGKITRAFAALRMHIRKIYGSVTKYIQRRPFVSFYLALAIFVIIIVLSSILETPAKTPEPKSPPKEVTFYNIGTAPEMTVQAQIEKTGVVKVVALSGGVVQKIAFHEGDKITKGATLLNLSTNYQGGNALSLQRQLAGNQYQSSLDTYGLQKNLIQDQRNIATKSAENIEKMREISADARTKTNDLINLDQTILQNIDNSLSGLQNGTIPTPTGQTTDVAIAALLAQKVQLLAGLSQAKTGLSSADYQADAGMPPAQIANLQQDLTLKQLDLQEKMLDVNKEASRLQLQLAQVTEALMYPAAPVSGVVQRIFVHPGDLVSPGTQLAVIAQSAKEDPITAVAYVPQEIAGKISKIEESTLTLNGKTLKEFPYFVSSEAVSGNSYAVYYAVPDDYSQYLTDKGYIDIQIPIGYADTTVAAAYIPVDAIYQTEDTAYLFVNEKGIAKSRKVQLGGIYGNYVVVNKGLRDGDQVILTRNVVDGDRIQVLK